MELADPPARIQWEVWRPHSLSGQCRGHEKLSPTGSVRPIPQAPSM
jgi:hypothetical protein